MRSVELFSGAGGLALGLEKAGFENVAHIELGKNACETLRFNRPHWNVLQSDVRDVDFSKFGTVDLVAGGPPCQPFSMGGKAKGYEDHRDMFPEAARAVQELRPKAFIFENVRGLLRPAFQNYVEFIRLQLAYPSYPVSKNVSWESNLQRLQRHHTSGGSRSSLEYKVSINLVDAADYGVPQRRHRVFFVGIRSDIDTNWFFPSPSHSQSELIRHKFVTGSYWKEHGLVKPKSIPPNLISKIEKLRIPDFFDQLARWRTVRDAISDLSDPNYKGEILDHRFQPGAKSYPGHTGSLQDEPAKALKAGDHGVPGGENMLRHSNGKVRYFTVRESARIQTFPDDYQFLGSWTESMRQIGNAVPVELAYAVALSVAKHICGNGRTRFIQSSGQKKSRKERC